MWELDLKEGWEPKNWCFWTVVLEKTLENLLSWKEVKPVNFEGNQPWIFIGRTDTEAEASIVWPPVVKSRLFGKDPDAGKVDSRRGRRQQRMRWIDNITDSMDMNLSKLWEIGKDTEVWHAAGHGVTKSQTQLNNWKTSTNTEIQVPSTNECLNTGLHEHTVWTNHARSLWSSQCFQSKRENRY